MLRTNSKRKDRDEDSSSPSTSQGEYIPLEMKQATRGRTHHKEVARAFGQGYGSAVIQQAPLAQQQHMGELHFCSWGCHGSLICKLHIRSFA